MDSIFQTQTRSMTDPVIVRNIAAEMTTAKKLLVFSLAYDATLWDSLTTENTYFVENNEAHIAMSDTIDPKRIIHCDYGSITVARSFTMTGQEVDAIPIPSSLLTEAPFDVIFVNGPLSYNASCPGRLLPLLWSRTLLSTSGTVVYVDDSDRHLESLCIEQFFGDCDQKRLGVRGGCMRIVIP
jgi:hypothetical protein